MAAHESLHDAFVDELRGAYDAEKQMLMALPKMADAAASEALRTTFDEQVVETEAHVARLDLLFKALTLPERRKRCDGIAGILAEVTVLIDDDADEATRDACLIASSRRASHYGIASYGTLVSWARTLGHDHPADVLQAILAQKTAAESGGSGPGGTRHRRRRHADGA